MLKVSSPEHLLVVECVIYTLYLYDEGMQCKILILLLMCVSLSHCLWSLLICRVLISLCFIDLHAAVDAEKNDRKPAVSKILIWSTRHFLIMVLPEEDLEHLQQIHQDITSKWYLATSLCILQNLIVRSSRLFKLCFSLLFLRLLLPFVYSNKLLKPVCSIIWCLKFVSHISNLRRETKFAGWFDVWGTCWSNKIPPPPSIFLKFVVWSCSYRGVIYFNNTQE